MARELVANKAAIGDNEGLAIERPRDAANARGLGRTTKEPDMTSVAHADTESDTNALESLDWGLSCGFDWHPSDVPPAEWAVWVTPKPCGCPTRGFWYTCALHWDNKGRQPMHCTTCGHKRLLGDSIAKAVRL